MASSCHNKIGCEKWWVLNRIADRKVELEIIKLLEKYKQRFIKIGFRQTEYVQRSYRARDFSRPNYFKSEEYTSFGRSKRLRVLDYYYHDKNQYIMNNV